jgi:membrane-associated protease RseP (regulator of RpoE activity)
MRPAFLLLTLAVTPVFAAQNGYESVNNPENRPMLGINMGPVSLSEQERQGLTPSQGVYVNNIYDNSAAQNMGLRPGDVITGMNGAPITSMSDLRNEVALNQVGDPVEVTFRRNGQEQSAISQLQSWPSNIPYDSIDPALEQRFRDWQDRRLARMQDEVEQLRNQAQDLAKKQAAAEEPGVLGVRGSVAAGPDGKPTAWRFTYGIRGVPGQDVATTTSQPRSLPIDSAAHGWRFTWKLLSENSTKESL